MQRPSTSRVIACLLAVVAVGVIRPPPRARMGATTIAARGTATSGTIGATTTGATTRASLLIPATP